MKIRVKKENVKRAITGLTLSLWTLLALYYFIILMISIHPSNLFNWIIGVFIFIIGVISLHEMNYIVDPNHPKIGMFLSLRYGNKKQRVLYFVLFAVIYFITFVFTLLLLPLKTLDYYDRYLQRQKSKEMS
jgi:small-conductance mechanosensitive channel